jgi:hypothetical protein
MPMTALVEVAPERPYCHSQHTQSFSLDNLRETLRQPSVNFYCPRSDTSWIVGPDQRLQLTRILASHDRRAEERI